MDFACKGDVRVAFFEFSLFDPSIPPLPPLAWKVPLTEYEFLCLHNICRSVNHCCLFGSRWLRLRTLLRNALFGNQAKTLSNVSSKTVC